MFLANGLAKVFFSFSALPRGAILVILAKMVVSNFPQSVAMLLGITLAMELLSSGVTRISCAFFVKNGGSDETMRPV